MKKNLIKLGLISALLFSAMPSFAAMTQGIWSNDLSSLFARNEAIILAVNIRTFNSKDTNKNDIIEIEKGEISGNFINAIDRLDEIANLGINTIHLLPITPTGKVKAMGTAGSLYAITAFDKLNPQLDDPTNNLSVMQEAKKFIAECHKRNIRVIVDLPSCGAYDLYLERPNLFLKGTDGQPVVPADWTDVRLFKVKNEDGSLNDEVFIEYKNFVDMVQRLGADGIRADVATSKPYEFWEKLISYAKTKDNQFLFLAEASESWTQPVADGYVFTPYNKLLEAGFDGWYGSFFNFKNWNSVSDLEKQLNLIKSVKQDFAKKNRAKSVIGSFATHDEVSPIITGGTPFSKMIVWLQATLPINSYYVDGFQTGDAYQYGYENSKAEKTYTDDNIYYVHKGKLDIFNFSKKPGMDNDEIKSELIRSNNLKILAREILNKGDISILNTNNSKVFAYEVAYKCSSIVVVVNKDLIYQNDATVKIKKLVPKNYKVIPFVMNASPIIKKGQIDVRLMPGDVCIIFLNKRLNQ